VVIDGTPQTDERIPERLREMHWVHQKVKRLGPRIDQCHFIDMYIGLSLFALGEYPAAAAQWLEALHGAAAVFNIRGMAGVCEGCAYICTKLGTFADAVRFLACAQKIRERTAAPLFNFWIAHHDATEAALRAELDPAEFEGLWSAGQLMKEEDIVNEVSTRLRDFSATSTQ
jgi:hypothetical protein